MNLKIEGSIVIECDGEEITVDGSQFGLEEAGNRSLGEGDFQYETLHIYFDPDGRFKVLVESTLLQEKITIYPAKIDGAACIVEDDLAALAV